MSTDNENLQHFKDWLDALKPQYKTPELIFEHFKRYFPQSKQHPQPIFDAEKINNRLDQLVAMEEGFNIAREVYSGNPTGRIEYFDGDCGYHYPYKYKTFLDYQNSMAKASRTTFQQPQTQSIPKADDFVFYKGEKPLSPKFSIPSTESNIVTNTRDIDKLTEKYDGHPTDYIEQDIKAQFKADIEKLKPKEEREVLFTTFDGSAVYEHKSVWYVCNGETEIHKTTFNKGGYENTDKTLYKFFSTYEAAEKYLNENNKKFSYNDIISCCHDDSCRGGILYLHLDKLNELLKSK